MTHVERFNAVMNFESVDRYPRIEWAGYWDKTLDRWCKATYNMTFSAIFKVKRGTGVISLRRTGFKLAETNGSVYIFLAKNYLGLKEKPEGDEIAEALPVQITIQVEDANKSQSQ